MTLTKTDLITKISLILKLEYEEAEEIVNAFFEEVRLALEHGENVKLSGFGNFEIRNKPDRPGRNPKTGDVYLISARKSVGFRAGPKLKGRVAGSVPKKTSYRNKI